MPVAVGFEINYIPGPATYDAGDIDFTALVGFEVRVISETDVSGGIRVGGSTVAFSGISGGLKIGGTVKDSSFGGIRVGGQAFSYTLIEASGGVRIGGQAVNYVSGGIRVGGSASLVITPSDIDIRDFWMFGDLQNYPYDVRDYWMFGE